MKKLINDPAGVVSDALRGVAAAHPELRVDHHHKIIYRREAPVTGKVGLVSGGGSGHEPLHGGFVGPGMLDAACAGEVFTSPVPDQILEATRNVDGGAGVLHIVKNYTGDVMNFEMAAELAAEAGIDVVSVVTDDDVAGKDSRHTAGRRGVGVTVLVEKIAGAAAEQGRSLAKVAEVARKVNARGRSMGMALTSCAVPAVGRPTFDLAETEMEIGIGIHGEPGQERKPLESARQVAEQLLAPILADLDFTGDDGVIAFVNGMGGTPLIELYVMYHEIATILHRTGVRVVRSLVGPYITSLEMAGCSVTLLKVDDDLLGLWDAPVCTPALRWGPVVPTSAPVDGLVGIMALSRWIIEFARLIAEQRDFLSELDSPIGDADHGVNMDRGMSAVVAALERTPQSSAAALLKHAGMTLQSTAGGASGPLYGTLFLRMASAAGGVSSLDAPAFAKALRAGLEGVVARGKAELGDKTMVDALAPAVDALERELASGRPLGAALRAAASAAKGGRDATIPMLARKGRASYLGERSVGHQDPGATSVALLITAAATAVAQV